MPFPGATTSGFSFSSLNSGDNIPGDFPNPSNTQNIFGQDRSEDGHSDHEAPYDDEWEDLHQEETTEPHNQPAPNQRRYPPRTCRICLEVVLPTYETPADGIASVFNPAPKVSYISSDPEDGRLIRPCTLYPQDRTID
jgi:hypothetical protein